MRKKVVLLAFVCVFLVPTFGFGYDIPWPDWKDSDLTLWAVWNSQLGDPTSWGANPGGLLKPNLSFDETEKEFEILAENYPNANPVKLGFVFIALPVFDNIVYDPSVEVTSSLGDEAEGVLLGSKALDGWVAYAWSFELRPNPCKEEVDIYLFGDAVGADNLVAQCDLRYVVALATKCAVPIPGAIWLFGAGLVGLLGFRKKRTRK